MLIMTGRQLAEARRAGMKRAIMGSDVRCHNGARSQVHRNAKKECQRFGRKQKDAALRGED